MSNTFAENKKARFNYEILDQYVGGIALLGTEVKSIRAKKVDLTGCYVIIQNNEAWLLNMTIVPYQKTNITTTHKDVRTRKILIHRKEIHQIQKEVQTKGLTAVPLSLFEENGMIKVAFAIVKGKKNHDKRESIKKKETKRNLDRTIRTRI